MVDDRGDVNKQGTDTSDRDRGLPGRRSGLSLFLSEPGPLAAARRSPFSRGRKSQFTIVLTVLLVTVLVTVTRVGTVLDQSDVRRPIGSGKRHPSGARRHQKTSSCKLSVIVCS